MRREVMVGGILGLLLGGLVTFVLAYEPTKTSTGSAPDLAPLQLSDSAWEHDHGGSTDGGHRPVRPGSERVFDVQAARS